MTRDFLPVRIRAQILVSLSFSPTSSSCQVLVLSLIRELVTCLSLLPSCRRFIFFFLLLDDGFIGSPSQQSDSLVSPHQDSRHPLTNTQINTPTHTQSDRQLHTLSPPPSPVILLQMKIAMTSNTGLTPPPDPEEEEETREQTHRQAEAVDTRARDRKSCPHSMIISRLSFLISCLMNFDVVGVRSASLSLIHSITITLSSLLFYSVTPSLTPGRRTRDGEAFWCTRTRQEEGETKELPDPTGSVSSGKLPSA